MLRALGVVGIVALGCTHSGASISPADYAADAANALCDYEVRCGLFADQASCVAYGQTMVDPTFEMLVASGKVTFDGSVAQECLDAIVGTSCDQTQMTARILPDACSHYLVGTVAMGSACEQNAECQSGACAIGDCQQACCTGTCAAVQAPAGSGDPCITRPCEPDLTCSTNTGTCAALGGMSDACALPTDCDFGLGCAGGECQPLPAVGQPCLDGQCADVGAVCNEAGTCVMVGLPGAACATDADCSQFAECNGTTCVAFPMLGESCDAGCSDGSYCNIADGGSGSGTCTALGSDGTPCTVSSECANGYCPSGTCETPPLCL
ncbi:MAG TPA: hypothetical protein VGG74_06895 [Kofleriaceae bacterium]|jgi:hypothetical protein